MLHHASRLLKCSYIPPDTTSSFSAILQSAAARAWTRRVKYHGSLLPDKKHVGMSRKSRSDESFVRQPQTPCRGQYVIPIDPDSISIREASWKDPGRAEPMYIPNPPSESATFVSAHSLAAAPIPHLPTPTSCETFYQNLLDMHNYSHSSLTHYTRQLPFLKPSGHASPSFNSFLQFLGFSCFETSGFRHCCTSSQCHESRVGPTKSRNVEINCKVVGTDWQMGRGYETCSTCYEKRAVARRVGLTIWASGWTTIAFVDGVFRLFETRCSTTVG